MTPHQDIRDHFVTIRDYLKRNKWTSAQVADVLGVALHTSYQYGFNPSTRGSRIVPADKLDRLRDAAAAVVQENRERGFPGFFGRKEHLWVVVGKDLSVILETTSPWHAAWHAAQNGGVAMPSRDNLKNRNDRLRDDDRLCIEWLELRHGGLITKEDAMAVAGVDAWLVERIGHEHDPWRIQPTREQVDALREIHLGRFRHAA